MTNIYNNEPNEKDTNDSEFNETYLIQEEEDVPFGGKFERETQLAIKQNYQKMYIFDKIKGHKLLGWCIFILVIVFIFEEFKNSGKMSPAGSSLVEIIKVLIFSLTGFLFGTKDNNER